MTRALLLSLIALLGAVVVAGGPVSAEPLKINGSTTVNLPVAEAAEILRAEKGMTIQVDTQGGSSGGISMLAEGLVQLGMTSKPVSAADRAKFPRCDFREIQIGEDAVAMIVSKDVWDGGVKSLEQGATRRNLRRQDQELEGGGRAGPADCLFQQGAGARDLGGVCPLVVWGRQEGAGGEFSGGRRQRRNAQQSGLDPRGDVAAVLVLGGREAGVCVELDGGRQGGRAPRPRTSRPERTR